MKKCLSIVMSLMMLIGMMSVGNFSYVSAYNMGDFNRDGVVNTRDVREVLLGIVADKTFTSAEKALAELVPEKELKRQMCYLLFERDYSVFEKDGNKVYSKM